MSQPIAISAMRFAGPVAATPQAQPVSRPVAEPIAVEHLPIARPIVEPVATAPQAPPAIMHPLIWRIPLPILPISLPLASTRNGNLFTDRNNPYLHWYLPQFALAADVDLSFIFAASQTSQQSDGTPFNAVNLAFSLAKSMPSDASQFAQANPSAILKEIPLENLAASLASPYTDAQGNQAVRSFAASAVTVQSDGSYLIQFQGSILGDAVVALYQDLRLFGKSSLKLTASFSTWAPPGAPAPPLGLKVTALSFQNTAVMSSALRNAAIEAPQPAAAPAAATPLVERAQPEILFRPLPPPPHPYDPPVLDPPPPPQLVVASQPFELDLPIGLKYNADGYQLQYTITTLSSPSRIILSVADLNGFNAPQSQYVELKELGNINAKYPSISRAYIGVLSKIIVLIPQRYSILRSKSGCSASCLARVDSSPSSTSQCAFEFSFVLGPEINRVELAQFQNDVAAVTDLHGYSVTFPTLLKDTPASTLQTSFASTASFSAGSDPHTFALTVTVQDNGPATPAVADANLFILRLTAQTGTDLIGSLSLKLDDGFTDPVLSTVDLNFAHTTGSDELACDFDPTVPAFNLSNLSPLDLNLQEYALVQGSTVTLSSNGFVLPGRTGKALPAPANSTGMSLIAAAQLALPTPMTMASVPNYLNFQTVDVQQTRYMIAIDATGVDWKSVTSVAVSVTFPTLTSIAPMSFTLGPVLQSSSQSVLVPLVNALSTLPGSLDITVNFTDTSKPAVEFTLTNDFVSQPVMTLLQTQIAAQLSTQPTQ